MLEKVVIGNATLYFGDALIVLPQLDVAADALITDPPYSSGADRMQSTKTKYVSSKARGAKHNVEFSGDNRDARSFKYWLSLVFILAREQLRPGAYALCFSDWRQLLLATDAFQAGGLLWRGIIPWDKTESSRGPHTGYFRHQCEYVVCGSHGPLPKSTWGGPLAGCYRERVNPAKKLHMTGKPVELMARLLQCQRLAPGSRPIHGLGKHGRRGPSIWSLVYRHREHAAAFRRGMRTAGESPKHSGDGLIRDANRSSRPVTIRCPQDSCAGRLGLWPESVGSAFGPFHA